MNTRRRYKAKAKRAYKTFHRNLQGADIRVLCGVGHGGSFACLKRMVRADLKAPTVCRYHGGRSLP